MYRVRSSLNKGNKKGCVLTSEQLDDLREFLDELDLIPLGAIPSELWPLVYEHQDAIRRDAVPFDNISSLVMKPLAERLRERKRIRVIEQQEDLFELCV